MSRVRIALGLLGTLALLGGTLFGPYVFILSGVQFTSRFEFAPLQVTDPEFSWETLPPSKALQWRHCFEELQCARLIVPLDHADPHGAEAIIAVIRKPSPLAHDPKLYRGPIIFNPGGPGGSGIELVKGPRAGLLSTYVGPEFDVLSFDPRGIGLSTPRASFFKTDAERAIWGPGPGVANNSDEGVARTWARARVLGQLAGENDHGSLRFFDTEQTARDMLNIVEAHGRSKLQYWGFSYGTVLGAAFASLFPDKVERLIIDGVVDTDEFFGIKWSNNLMDADKVLESFFAECASAGPDNCRFWAPTANDIRQNLTNLYDSIRARPIPVKSESGYGIVDYAMLRMSVFRALYSPYAAFQSLAERLAALAAGDASLLFDASWRPPFECSCEERSVPFSAFDEPSIAIFCNDNLEVPNDLEWSKDYFAMMAKSSSWADVWASNLIACQGWPKFPKTNFRGPFEGNTSHPILLIGNTADPVTPLWDAHKMSRGFVGSVVLTQDSAGHCSVSGPSLCTQRYVRQYFLNGTLPEPGTVCDVIDSPFPKISPGRPGDREAQSVLSQTIDDWDLDDLDDSKTGIIKTVVELSKMPFVSPFHY